MKKRLFSILMALVMVLSLLPATALAADDGLSYDENGFSTGGDSVTYQPATQVTADNCENLGLTESYVGYYAIGNAGQLYWFAGLVNGTLTNGTTQNTTANAVLTADITVNTGVLDEDGALASDTTTFKDWTPIGSAEMDSVSNNEPADLDVPNAYAGTFNGQNHTITGLYLNNSEKSQCGLFGVIRSDASISNVTVSGSYISGNTNVGGVCGYNYHGSITGCTSSGTIKSTHDTYSRTGGVAGYNAGTITNCTNFGTISAAGNSTGGVCGYNASTGKMQDCTNSGAVSGPKYTGGVCGYNNSVDSNKGSITNCTNSGTITGTGESNKDNYGRTGGVAGYNGGTISGCRNTDTINSSADCTGGVCGYNKGTISANCTNSGAVSGPKYTGGLCGFNSLSTITNSTNSGAVNGTDYTGGVSGYNSGSIANCTNFGKVTGSGDYTGGVCGDNNSTSAKIQNCTNSGTVAGADYTGGLCGYNTSAGKIQDCTNSGKVTGTKKYTGGVCGYNNYASITNCTNSGTVTGGVEGYTGGVCGYNQGSGIIQNCTNTGNVSGTHECTGGVCGYNAGTVTNCTNSGAVSGPKYTGGVCSFNASTGKIQDCTNFGAVTGGVEGYTGGVCGYNNSTTSSKGTITNCYFNSDAYLGKAVGTDLGTTTNVEGKTAAQFASGEVAWLLRGGEEDNGSSWGQKIGTDAYPVPGGETVYRLNALRCDGQVLDTYFFSNSTTATVPDHTFSGNTCTVCGYSMPIIPVIPTYPPTVTQPAEGGSVTVSTNNPAQGSTVTVTPKPEDGYEVGSVTVTDRNGNPVEVTDNGDGTYSFRQPAGAVKVEVQFKETACDGGADCSSHGFTDVNTNLWYHEAIDYVVENGIMNGVGGGKFDPTGNLSRSMLMTMLARLDGVDTDGGANWYEKGLNWAVANGVSDGTNPDGDISRQEVAAMLYRYAQLKGYDTSARADLSAFTDGDQTASWAEEAMEWAVQSGVLQGDNNRALNPEGSATRAEVAQMLMNFLSNLNP